MTLQTARLFMLVSLAFLGGVERASAQDVTVEIKKNLDSLDKRLDDLRREEQELLKLRDFLMKQLATPMNKQAAEWKARDDAWLKKNGSKIELRAKLHSSTTSTLLNPPAIFTSWSAVSDGEHFSLDFGPARRLREPSELREEQGVEVLIKGRVEVRPLSAIVSGVDEFYLLRHSRVIRTIHVESIEKLEK